MGIEGEERKPFKRLPTSVVPANYQITLQPNLETFKFKGNQIVDIEVGKVNRGFIDIFQKYANTSLEYF